MKRTAIEGCGQVKRTVASSPKNRFAALVAMAAWLVATPALAVVTLHVATNDAVPGGSLALSLSMTRDAGESVASAQLDVTFQTGQLQLTGTCSNDGAACEQNAECGTGHCQLRCSKDARLGVQDFNATFPEFQNLPPGQRKVRLRLLAPIQAQLPLPTFDDGTIATCTFDVPSGAGLGQINLAANRVEVGNGEGDPLAATVVIEPGNIVSELPTPTQGATDTPTPVATDTAVPTATFSDTPTAVNTGTMTPTTKPTSPAPATSTATLVPTATRTTQPTNTIAPTATRTSPPTPTQTGGRRHHGGCSISEDGATASGLVWLFVPVGLLALRRRGSR